MAFKDQVSSLDRIATALEGMATAEGAGIPTPKAEDSGKVLTVGSDGKWKLATIPTELPAVESTDEGKVLTVDSNGKWVADSLPASNDTEPAGE